VWARLADFECDSGQGFLLGRPEPPDRLTPRLLLPRGVDAAAA
jgi:EAL domain-containing protein (putative c-di-GMP-specific phosphodiesterase class I)